MKTLEIEKRWTGKYVWRFKAANGKVVSHGEEYYNKQDCIDGALLGSPVHAVGSEENSDKMWYSELDVQSGEVLEVEGKLEWIDTPPINPGTANQYNPVIVQVGSDTLRRDETGHFILNEQFVLHPKNPEEPCCAEPGCPMAMDVL